MTLSIARLLLPVLLLGLLSGCDRAASNTHQAAADNPVLLGERKARVCMSCHGPGGVSRVASYPSLAGLDREYLLAQLRDFKSGERENAMMSSMVASLTDTDMQQLAAYFSVQGD